MTLQQIYYLIQIADTGSINRAAEKLFLSQPALTNAVKEIETELGFQILNRTPRGISLTRDGSEFLAQARQLYEQYDLLLDHYGAERRIRQRFGISTQHYSFVIKAFANMTRRYDTLQYQFSVLETRTIDVIRNVISGKSDIGILYLSSFNQRFLNKLLKEALLTYHPLIECSAYVYLHRSHPLAQQSSISFDELLPYPCIQFDQGENSSDFLAEEILIDREYPRVIKTSDRATNLNLMVSIHGYTLCSGIISKDLNGSEYLAIPFREDKKNKNQTMRIGYILKRGTVPNDLMRSFIAEVEQVLKEEQGQLFVSSSASKEHASN